MKSGEKLKNGAKFFFGKFPPKNEYSFEYKHQTLLQNNHKRDLLVILFTLLLCLAFLLTKCATD